MSIRNLISVSVVLRFDMRNVSGFLLQDATVITYSKNFITKCDSYYKMRRLLQAATLKGVISGLTGLTGN